eukprot:SM000140S00595  [mRNA]  locus=s140:147996:150943:+ [translate_table: standard]
MAVLRRRQVVGDLHLEPPQAHYFEQGRSQIAAELRGGGGDAVGTITNPPASDVRLFQLGDLGAYSNFPGSTACFQTAREFLDGFGMQCHMILGNHDLEGAEFDSDGENLAAWAATFGQRHYWSVPLGGGAALAVGLSTVRFRASPNSCHEEVHVRNLCAWLNHSNRPQRFMELVCQHPQIKLWFSGHFHLSHDYEHSVNKVGACHFVQVSVMGDCHRDGLRQSRIVRGDAHGFQIYTLDHGSGYVRQDLAHSYAADPLCEAEKLWCSTLRNVRWCRKGGTFSPEMPASIRDAPADDAESLPSGEDQVRWFKAGDTVLALSGNQLVQYDPATEAPLGVVCDAVNGRGVKLVIAANKQVDYIQLFATPESAAIGAERNLPWAETQNEQILRQGDGSLVRVFQRNKWVGVDRTTRLAQHEIKWQKAQLSIASIVQV